MSQPSEVIILLEEIRTALIDIACTQRRILKLHCDNSDLPGTIITIFHDTALILYSTASVSH
ncbi:MAG: hypothetical protein WCC17_13520 [Candidatus Nitrosopolaris sp.]